MLFYEDYLSSIKELQVEEANYLQKITRDRIWIDVLE